MSDIRTRRLVPGDRELARRTFALMAAVFDEPAAPLSDEYLDRLLKRDDFWAIAALVDGDVAGGVTAHTLPMTRGAFSEIFIYDVAVRRDQQRQGIGRRMIAALREAAAAAGIHELFVPVDQDDENALDFYRALGGRSSPVTFFSFSAEDPITFRR